MEYLLENQSLKVRINGIGAELASVKSADGRKEYLWQGDRAHWVRQAPVLFPIVGGLKGDCYRVAGREYSMAKHGFARDLEFDLLESEADRLLFGICENEETLKVYPYRFALKIEYRLKANRLTQTFFVANPAEKTLLFSIGSHPGFRVPIDANEKYTDYSLVFERKETADRRWIGSDGLIAERRACLENEDTIPLRPGLFKNDALVFDDLKSKWVAIASGKTANRIQVDISDFPYLGIWNSGGEGEAPFVCIEPWRGIADSTNSAGNYEEKEGIERLKAGASVNYGLSMDFT